MTLWSDATIVMFSPFAVMLSTGAVMPRIASVRAVATFSVRTIRAAVFVVFCLRYSSSSGAVVVCSSAKSQKASTPVSTIVAPLRSTPSVSV